VDIVLHLGGNPNRTYKAAEIATRFPLTKVIVSSEGSIGQVLDIYKEKGLTQERIDLDFNAWDTVTNFTETANKIKLYQPKKLYVVTDAFHMRRSLTIAQICYFNTAVEVIPCSSVYNSPNIKEPISLILTDAAQASIWKMTGRLLYDAKVKTDRWPGIKAEEQAAKAYRW
jgi:uncharacterized SAM-binding protein YcdF (DUF218 family)